MRWPRDGLIGSQATAMRLESGSVAGVDVHVIGGEVAGPDAGGTEDAKAVIRNS